MNVLYEKIGKVGLVTLNRPEKMNALTFKMLEEFPGIFASIRRDPQIHVVVITGAGDQAFCAGQDLEDLKAFIDAGKNSFRDNYWSATGFESILTDDTFSKPVISAINGHCIGYGLTIALSSDVRIASDQAKFGYPEVKMGTPTVIGAIKLPRIAALGPAMELLLVGDLIESDEAYRLGLISRIVKQDLVLETAMAMAEKMARNDLVALMATKEIAMTGLGQPFREAWRKGEAMRALSFNFKKLKTTLELYLTSGHKK
jgi:enoyl-CoA hydratase/carnithine racemase